MDRRKRRKTTTRNSTNNTQIHTNTHVQMTIAGKVLRGIIEVMPIISAFIPGNKKTMEFKSALMKALAKLANEIATAMEDEKITEEEATEIKESINEIYKQIATGV